MNAAEKAAARKARIEHSQVVRRYQVGNRVVWVQPGRNYRRQGEVAHVLDDGRLILHFNGDRENAWQITAASSVEPAHMSYILTSEG
jgi:hypothetical protein